ncbi:mechanosensitive ion channel domain-containing protein [Rubritalea spongiae]|uniref:Mechanosensitive ion channel domain-containing protein n=1 Tax=Rubritalea spongiae TaxID=430797 RepID=A0ABW5DZC4_9BACT
MNKFHCVVILLLLNLPLFAQDDVKENNDLIAVQNVTSDEAIKNRISEIYQAVGGFDGITITVQSGVVKLTGEIADDSTREDAVSLASRTDGAVLIIDRLEEPVEITNQLAPAYEKVQEMGRALVTKLPLIAAALALLFFGYLLSRFISKHHNWLDRMNVSSLSKQLILRLITLAIGLLTVLTALELLDATAIVGAIIGAAGLVGIALGFAFKNIVENYLAGVLLSTRNPFEIGDSVEIDGNTGKVALLTARDTVLVTLDGNHLRIPNAVVMNSVLTNFTRNPLRRFDFYVGVSTDFDLDKVKRIAMDILKENPAVLEDPSPMVVVDNLGDSSVMIRLFGWVNQTNHDFLKSKSESIRLVKEAFDDAGIEMPEPIYRVHLRESPATISSSKKEEIKQTQERKSKKSVDYADIAPDKTIENQIHDEAGKLDEENLLNKQPLSKS